MFVDTNYKKQDIHVERKINKSTVIVLKFIFVNFILKIKKKNKKLTTAISTSWNQMLANELFKIFSI